MLKHIETDKPLRGHHYFALGFPVADAAHAETWISIQSRRLSQIAAVEMFLMTAGVSLLWPAAENKEVTHHWRAVAAVVVETGAQWR